MRHIQNYFEKLILIFSLFILASCSSIRHDLNYFENYTAHVWSKNDSLKALALSHATTVDKIRRDNNIYSEHDLGEGSLVYVPKNNQLSKVKSYVNKQTSNFNTGIIWPVHGVITSKFGPRWGRMHQGLDIAGKRGEKVKNVAIGVVTEAGWINGYGNIVTIKHNSNIKTRYAHLSRILVVKGQQVFKDQAIGIIGQSGNATGIVLHFEVIVNNEPKDPLHYLQPLKYNYANK